MCEKNAPYQASKEIWDVKKKKKRIMYSSSKNNVSLSENTLSNKWTKIYESIESQWTKIISVKMPFHRK